MASKSQASATETAVGAPTPAAADVPASTHMSDDPAVLHVAAATLAQKIEALGLPTGAISDTMVTTTAKAMLDAVDNFIEGGGGTQPA